VCYERTQGEKPELAQAVVCCEKADGCKRLAEASLVGFLGVLWLAVLPKGECSAKPGLGGVPGSETARDGPPYILEPNGLHAPWETCIRFLSPTSSCSLHTLFLLLQRFWKSREISSAVRFQAKAMSERHRADKSAQLHV